MEHLLDRGGIAEGGQRVGTEEGAGLVGEDVALAVDVDPGEGRGQAKRLLEDLAQRLGAEDVVPAGAVLALGGEGGDLAAEVHREPHVVVDAADRDLEGAGLVGGGDLRREAGVGGLRPREQRGPGAVRTRPGPSEDAGRVAGGKSGERSWVRRKAAPRRAAPGGRVQGRALGLHASGFATCLVTDHPASEQAPTLRLPAQLYTPRRRRSSAKRVSVAVSGRSL